MAKSSKKVPVKPIKPITEFFTRKPTTTTPISSQPKLSQTISTGQSGLGLAQKATKTHFASSIVHTISTDSQLSTATTTNTTKSVATRSNASNISLQAKPRTFMEAVEIVSPPKKARSNRSYYPNPSIVSLNSMPSAKPPPARPKSASLVRRKTKFDSDSDVEKLESVVYISKSPLPPASTTPIRAAIPLRPKENFSLPAQPSARKKPRLSSPDPGVKSVLGDVVPSSQSDEQEMMLTRLPQRDPALIKQHIDEWRQMAVSLTPADEMQMDVDPSPSSSLSSPGSSGSAINGNTELRNNRASTLLASPIFGREDTPPPIARASPFSPLPPSPVALDPETKTAMIIAKIREKAYADNMSSPLSSPTMEFKDELDDSSDEEDIIPWSPTKGKPGKQMNPIMAPQPSPISNRRSGRLSLRNLELSPSPSSVHFPVHSRRTRTAPNRGPVIPTQGLSTKKGKGKAFDPLDELLKEKKLADKRGKGDAAFRLAEGAIAGKDAMMDEMSLESDSADWSNENAARMAVDERARIDMKSLSPVASGSGNGGDVMLSAQDPERLLGEKRGKAVVNILDGDRKKKQVEQEAEKVAGISLWSEPSADERMAVDQAFPTLMNPGNNSLAHTLSTSIEKQDFVKAALLLDSGVFTFIDLTEHSGVVPYLCALALSSHETLLNASASRLLCHIWDTTTQAVPGLPFDTVLTTLVKLGTKLPILSSLGWDVDPHIRSELITVQQRDEILYRLVGLLTSSARAGRVPSEQAPDMMMAMLVVAHDQTTSPQLHREIVLAIDEVCRSVAPGDELFKTLEAATCTKILCYLTTQTSVNKAFIMNTLAAGTGRTRRVARWTAHALVTGSATVSSASYSDLPPLLPILDQLRRVTDRDSAETPGIFELHEKTDYVDLGFNIQVLAVAISKVRGYVEQERIARRATPSNPKNPEELPETMIQMVHQAIEKRHSSISDVRAAHLDRSRAKAALKELSMRIHYQILSSRGSGTGTGKPRNLRQYFGPKN